MNFRTEPANKSEQRGKLLDIAPRAMKCIVINLPRAEDRRRAMYRQFDALGIEFEIFDAIDWRDLSEEDWALVDRNSREMEGRRPLSDGMIACHLSHRKALEGVAAGGDELTAIFEDDVTVAPEIGGALEALARLYASGWEFDFVFLHRQSMDKPFAPLKRVDAGIRLGITKFSDWGAQGYVVSKKGASRLLKNCPKIVNRNDHTLHAYWVNGTERFLSGNARRVSWKRGGRPFFWRTSGSSGFPPEPEFLEIAVPRVQSSPGRGSQTRILLSQGTKRKEQRRFSVIEER